MTRHCLYKSFLLLICFSCTFLSKGQDNIDSLLYILNKTNSDTSKINIYTKLCIAYIPTDPDKALIYCEEGLTLAHKIDYKKGLADSYDNMGNLFWMQGQYSKALDYNFKSLNIRKDLKDAKGVSRVFNNIGIIFYDQGNYENALIYIKKSIDILKLLDDKKSLATRYNNIGLIYEKQGMYDKALEYLLNSLKIAVEGNEKKMIELCYNNIGNIHFGQENYEKALVYYFKSLTIGYELKNKIVIATSFGNIGNVFYKKGLYDKAMEYYIKELTLSEELGDKKSIARSYNKFGSVFNIKGNYKKGMEYYMKDLKICEEIGDLDGKGRALCDIAELHLVLADSVLVKKSEKNRHYVEAVSFGLKSFNLSLELNALPQIKSTSQVLYKAYKSIGDLVRALKYAELFIASNDSMFKEEKTKALAEMEAKYQNEKKEKELTLKSNELNIQKISIRNKNIIIYVVLTGLFLAVLLIFVIFVMYKRNYKAYHSLVRQNLEILSKEKELKILKAGHKEINEIPIISIDIKYSSSLLGKEEKNNIINRLERILDENKIYLNLGLTIEQLADKIEVHKKYLSQVINEKYNMNFNNFINKYRVEEARRILADTANDIPIKKLYPELGFKSSETFYTAFKSHTGLTPIKFRNLVKKQML